MFDQNLSSFIWSVADLLRGGDKQSEYGMVILPFAVLSLLGYVLEQTIEAVIKLRKFENLIGEAQQSIYLFKERCSALILTEVTGQIDVQGEVST